MDILGVKMVEAVLFMKMAQSLVCALTITRVHFVERVILYVTNKN